MIITLIFEQPGCICKIINPTWINYMSDTKIFEYQMDDFYINRIPGVIGISGNKEDIEDEGSRSEGTFE